MTDINAAAERLRRAKIPGEKPYYDIVKPPGDAASMHYAKIDDLKLLANAYIAEHDPKTSIQKQGDVSLCPQCGRCIINRAEQDVGVHARP